MTGPTTPDPFDALGLPRDATAADVRRTRRDLAKRLHPDAGGDADEMRRVNVAATEALERIVDPAGPDRNSRSRRSPGAAPGESRRDTPPGRERGDAPDAGRWDDAVEPSGDPWTGLRVDAPSFTVEALPVETFEALLLAAAELGEVVDDDPPYEMHVLLGEPGPCWCRLDVVPDAGASSVSIAIAAVDDRPLPTVESVRDRWITALNALDWSAL